MGDDRYDVSAEVAFREIEGELLLLTPQDEVIYTVNSSGKLAWERLVAGESLGEIADAMVAAYGLPVEVATRDLAAFVEELERKRVVSRRA